MQVQLHVYGGHKSSSIVFQVENVHTCTQHIFCSVHYMQSTAQGQSNNFDNNIHEHLFSAELLVVGIVSSQLAHCILGEMPILAVDRSQHTHNAD